MSVAGRKSGQGAAWLGAALLLGAPAMAQDLTPPVPPPADPAAATELFVQAGAAYERGDFATAASGYRRLLAADFATAAVYYNLGNTLFRLGRLGEAILSYERAQLKDPADPEVRENLAFVSSRIVDQVEAAGDGGGPLGAFWEWHGRQPPARLTLSFLAAWWLFNLGLAAALFAPSPRGRRAGGSLLAGMLLVVLLTGAILGLAVYRRDALVHGIVLAERVDLQSEPGGGVKLTTVHEGLKVRVLNHRGDWLELTLPNGVRGWVHGETVGIL